MTRRLLPHAIALPVLAVLTGCAVSPVALDDAELERSASVRTASIAAHQEPITGVISLHEAIARALKFNLDQDVETMLVSLRGAEAVVASSKMLPDLTVNYGLAARSNDLSTGSLSLYDPLPLGLSPADATSEERSHGTRDVTLSWHILDFALSYVRARQAADRQLIAEELKRKVTQRIVSDTRTAYWRALSCDRMVRKFEKLEQRTKRAIAATRSSAKSGAESPITALTYERELVQIRQTAERLRHELSLAKSQLAALMNLAPGTEFKLDDRLARPEPPVFHMSASEMVAEAIFNRPEIREVAYQRRISEAEATAAVLDLLPGLKLTAGQSFDDNSFLLHNDWSTWGIAAGGNLLKVLQYPARRGTIEAEQALLDEKALAVTMTVMTQVFISRIRYRHLSDLLDTAKEYLDVQGKLVGQLRGEKSADLIGEQTLIREEMSLLVAEVQHDIAIGELQSAASNILVTLGYNQQGRDVDLAAPVKTIAAHLQSNAADRASMSDRGHHMLLIERARVEAERRRVEAEKQKREAARRAAESAVRDKAEADKVAKLEAKRLKQDAEKAREDARQAARKGVKRNTPSRDEKPVWSWVWPTPATAETQDNPKKVYTGTK